MSSLRAVLEQHFYGDVAAERMHVLKSIFLLILSFDIWLELAGHAARYGAGDFNLSHFALLDAVQPMPSPGLYLGVTFGASILSFVGAWFPQPRWVRAMLFAAYSYGWAMSLHDSYQHHYLISLVLFCFVFVESVKSETSETDIPQTWAYPLLTTSIAIVYFYAAFAKLDAAWQSGDAFLRVAPSHAQTLFAYGARYDLSRTAVLSLIGTSVVGIQVVLGALYLVAPWFDRAVADKPLRIAWTGSIVALLATLTLLVFDPVRASAFGEFLPELAFVCVSVGLAVATLRWKWTRYLGLFAALSFHLGAEELGLKIGWFSYYMIFIAVLCLGPRGIARTIFSFARDVALTVADIPFKERAVILILLLIGAASAIAFAANVDLPGVAVGVGCAVLLVCADPLRALRRDARPAAITSVLLIVTGSMLWFSVTNSSVRFDYYRFLGGDLRRRGDLDGALEAYVRANRYAPEGKDRKDKEEQLRKALGR